VPLPQTFADRAGVTRAAPCKPLILGDCPDPARKRPDQALVHCFTAPILAISGFAAGPADDL